jgi:septum formation protein
MRLILASQSPRRQELLQQVGYDFRVIAPDEEAESGVCEGETTAELVARLAYQKAANVRLKVHDDSAVIVSCDTVADVDGEVLGKPRDRAHAEHMLQLLSGRRHSVFSGLCIWPLPNGPHAVQVACSELLMDHLSESQIQHYLDSGQWRGKSGAFGYQDGHPWLKLVSGTASNVVGLPLDLLRTMLAEVANWREA